MHVCASTVLARQCDDRLLPLYSSTPVVRARAGASKPCMYLLALLQQMLRPPVLAGTGRYGFIHALLFPRP